MTRWTHFILSLFFLGLLCLPGLASNPEYASDFTLPLKDYYSRGDRVVLSSWFYMVRNDGGGKIYGALNFPCKQYATVFAITDSYVTEIVYDKYIGLNIHTMTPKGLEIIYYHLGKVNIGLICQQAGKVKQGDTLAWVGRSGRTTGRNLGLEARFQGQKVCISPYFNVKWYCPTGEVKEVDYQ